MQTAEQDHHGTVTLTTTAGGDDAVSGREMIAILDFGSQYSRLIARRVRECRVFCELLPATTSLETLRELGACGVILSGGPDSVYDTDARHIEQAILESDLPILGICYGMQLLAHQLGGHVEPDRGRREYGPAEIRLSEDEEITDASALLFAGLDADTRGLEVWMSHGDSVDTPPPGFTAVARSETGTLAAMSNGRGHIGIQFHPEVSHTPRGKQLLENFLFRICGCSPTWTSGTFIEEAVRRIASQVG